jgi:hypothetical protein
MMSRSASWLLLVVVIAIVGAPACAAIEGIFKAGVWTGVILVVIALMVVAGVVVAMRR